MAYRLRYLLKTKGTSAFIESVRLMERLNEISRANGITEGRIMTQSFGPFNQIAVDVDYPDLATYEQEAEAYFSLPEVLEVVGKLDDVSLETDPGETAMWEDITSGQLTP
jgi:hypothetical protein